MIILTDAAGRPLDRPVRSDYANDADYVRAVHVYNDRVTNLANAVFDAAFRNAIK